VAKNFHEQFDRPNDSLPSERSTGFVLSGVALALAYLWRAQQPIAIAATVLGAVLSLLSLLAPNRLRLLNVVWFRFGMMLGKIISPIVLLVMYLVAIVPAGLLMQLRYDPLRKDRKSQAASYWIERQPEGANNMTNQF
jgi:hypothetical protein